MKDSEAREQLIWARERLSRLEKRLRELERELIKQSLINNKYAPQQPMPKPVGYTDEEWERLEPTVREAYRPLVIHVPKITGTLDALLEYLGLEPHYEHGTEGRWIMVKRGEVAQL